MYVCMCVCMYPSQYSRKGTIDYQPATHTTNQSTKAEVNLEKKLRGSQLKNG